MDALTYYKSNPVEVVEKVCEEAGTTIGYFRVCMHESPKNNNRFSHKLCKRLEAASIHVAETNPKSEGVMTKEELRPDIFGDIAA